MEATEEEALHGSHWEEWRRGRLGTVVEGRVGGLSFGVKTQVFW